MTAKQNPPAKVWANSTEAAELLGIHPTTLNQWRARRIGPNYYRHENGSIRYRLSDIDGYLTRCAYIDTNNA